MQLKPFFLVVWDLILVESVGSIDFGEMMEINGGGLLVAKNLKFL